MDSEVPLVPNLEANMKNQIDRIKSTPFLPKDTPVYGFIYDVRTGSLQQLVISKKQKEFSVEQVYNIIFITNNNQNKHYSYTKNIYFYANRVHGTYREIFIYLKNLVIYPVGNMYAVLFARQVE